MIPTRIRKSDFKPEPNGPTAFAGWVPENCPEVEGQYLFNAVYMDHNNGWIGRSMDGVFFFYSVTGEKTLLNQRPQQQELFA